MRILFLLTQDLESPSGLGRYLPLARELVKLGHQIKVAALHSHYQGLKKKAFVDDSGVEVFYVGQMHVLKAGSNKTYFSPVQLILLSILATIKMTWFVFWQPAEIVYICKPHPMNSIAGWVGGLLTGKRLFLDCDDYEAASNRFSGDWQRKLVQFIEDWIPHKAEVVTTNTMFNRERMIRNGVQVSKIIYMPNGVDPARFPRASAQELDQLRQELRIFDKKIIVYVGSLSIASHPVDLLVQAFARVHQSCPDTALLLVGGGEDIETLKDMVVDLGVDGAVVFAGRIAPDKVAAYYQLAKVSVDPVYDDVVARSRCPLKLFESWACGVPFVTADVGDRAELVGNPPAGVLVEGGDVSALAAAIRLVLDEPVWLQSFREAGLRKVEQYTWARLALSLAKRLT